MTLADQPRVEHDLCGGPDRPGSGALAAALYSYNRASTTTSATPCRAATNCFCSNPTARSGRADHVRPMVVDGDGTFVAGKGERETTASMIHRAATAPRVGALHTHTHMPFATAVSTTRGGFDTTLGQATIKFTDASPRSLRRAGPGRRRGRPDRIGRRPAHQRRDARRPRHDRDRNDAAEAWSRLYFLERACEVQIRPSPPGRELIEVPDASCSAPPSSPRATRSGRASCSTPSSGDSTRENPRYEL